MKQHPTQHRRVAALLFAAAALPFTPVLAQDTTATPPAPVVVTPPPVVVAPPPPVTTAPPPITLPPITTPRATTPPAPEARTTTRTTRTATRAPVRQAAPARRAPVTAAPEPAPPPAAEPVTTAIPPAPPVTEAPPLAEQSAVPVETVEPQRATPWALIAAILGLLAAGAIAFLMFSRRRRRVAERDYYEAPVAVAPVAPAIEPEPYIAPYVAPAMVREEPVAAVAETDLVTETELADGPPTVETLAVGAPASGDVAAMGAASEPQGNRPWLEMLMRPIRAGTTADDTRVDFELTVGNTGSVAAKDVRISTWMFPAGSETSEMEKLLIDSEDSMAPGDGTRVEASIALPKTSRMEAVLPVVVADATYRLPDGSEGHTRASFAVGLSNDGELTPFPTDRSSGLFESVEARLHGALERD